MSSSHLPHPSARRMSMSTARVLVATVLVLLSTTLFGQSVNPIPMVNQPLVPTRRRARITGSDTIRGRYRVCVNVGCELEWDSAEHNVCESA